MQFELKNPKLLQLDKEVYSFNNQYGLVLRSLTGLPNKFAMGKILDKLKILKKELKAIKTKDEFEKLFIRHNFWLLNITKTNLMQLLPYRKQ